MSDLEITNRVPPNSHAYLVRRRGESDWKRVTIIHRVELNISDTQLERMSRVGLIIADTNPDRVKIILPVDRFSHKPIALERLDQKSTPAVQVQDLDDEDTVYESVDDDLTDTMIIELALERLELVDPPSKKTKEDVNQNQFMGSSQKFERRPVQSNTNISLQRTKKSSDVEKYNETLNMKKKKRDFQRDLKEHAEEIQEKRKNRVKKERQREARETQG